MISSRAEVSPEAQFGARVEVGPFAVIEADVRIGDDCRVGPHVVLRSGTELGPGCRLGPGVVVGEPPMDREFEGEASRVAIGSGNDLREYVTIHRATGDGAATVLGDSNLVMAYVHVAHNCRVGSHVTLTNAVNLGGHVEVGDWAVIGGLTGIHQHVRVGAHAMVGACSYLSQDLPPFLLGSGNPFRVRGVNVFGLRRAGFSPATRRLLHELYCLVYRSRLRPGDAVERLALEYPDSPELALFRDFLSFSRRGIRFKR